MDGLRWVALPCVCLSQYDAVPLPVTVVKDRIRPGVGESGWRLYMLLCYWQRLRL